MQKRKSVAARFVACSMMVPGLLGLGLFVGGTMFLLWMSAS